MRKPVARGGENHRRARASIPPSAPQVLPTFSVGPVSASISPTDGHTGRYLILLDEHETKAASTALNKVAGLRIAHTGGSDQVTAADSSTKEGEAIVFSELGVAVVDASPERVSAVSAAVAQSSTLHLMEPERYVYASSVDLEYLRGYRDAVDHLYERLSGTPGTTAAALASLGEESEFSWGLQAARVNSTRFTGKGIKIAVLDTGLDLAHPDFTGRPVQTQSFIEGVASVQDGNGHGTHCCGVAAGPRRPQQMPRFAVAPDAELYVGKVLDDSGQGRDGNIIAGIRWAINAKCHIISMSLGGRVQPGQSYSAVFQQIGERAMAAGTVIFAAAGNDSNRPQLLMPVSHPANCPSIFAVAAVDRRSTVAYFSNAGLDSGGGKVDLAAPGVDVTSAWPSPLLYKSEDGTSMATPHVAGVAALLAEANDANRGQALWSALTRGAKPLSAQSRDVGSGLVQAP